MFRYLIRRLILMVPLLIGISFLVFAMLNMVPGSPMDRFEFGPGVTPADRDRIADTLGLNEPWYQRYFIWLSNAVTGDFGNSLVNFTPVETRIRETLPNTLLLTGTSLAFALVLAIPLGVWSAVRRNSLFDHITTVSATAFYSVPSLWLGLMLIILFSVQFQRWDLPSLPVAGVYDVRGGGGLLDRIEHLILPAFTLGIIQLAAWTRYIRSSMLEVIRQDFVRTAQAKGLRQRAVLFGHAFRNAMLPLITLIGLTIPDLFGGAVVVEEVFAWNGIGRLTINALQDSDYTVAMGTVMMLAFLTVVGNLISDILYGVMDPRVRLD